MLAGMLFANLQCVARMSRTIRRIRTLAGETGASVELVGFARPSWVCCPSWPSLVLGFAGSKGRGILDVQ